MYALIIFAGFLVIALKAQKIPISGDCSCTNRNGILSNKVGLSCSGYFWSYWISEFNDSDISKIIPEHGEQYILGYTDAPAAPTVLGRASESTASFLIWTDEQNRHDCIAETFQTHSNTPQCLIFKEHINVGTDQMRAPITHSRPYSLRQSLLTISAKNLTIEPEDVKFSLGTNHNHMSAHFLLYGSLVPFDLSYTLHYMPNIQKPYPKCIIRSLYTGETPKIYPGIYYQCLVATGCSHLKAMRVDMAAVHHSTTTTLSGYADPMTSLWVQTDEFGYEFHKHFSLKTLHEVRQSGTSDYSEKHWLHSNDDTKCTIEGVVVGKPKDQIATENTEGFRMSLGLSFWTTPFATSHQSPPAEVIKLQNFWIARKYGWADHGFGIFMENLDMMEIVTEYSPGKRWSRDYIRDKVAIWDKNGYMAETDYAHFTETKATSVADKLQSGSSCVGRFKIPHDLLNARWNIDMYDYLGGSTSFVSSKKKIIPLIINGTKFGNEYGMQVFDQFIITNITKPGDINNIFSISTTNCRQVRSISIESGTGALARTYGKIEFHSPNQYKTSTGFHQLGASDVDAILDPGQYYVWYSGTYSTLDTIKKLQHLKWYTKDDNGVDTIVGTVQVEIPSTISPYITLKDYVVPISEKLHGWIWSESVDGFSFAPIFRPPALLNPLVPMQRHQTQRIPQMNVSGIPIFTSDKQNIPAIRFDYIAPKNTIIRYEIHGIDTETNYIYKNTKIANISGVVELSFPLATSTIPETVATFSHGPNGHMIALNSNQQKNWGRYKFAVIIIYFSGYEQIDIFDFSDTRIWVKDAVLSGYQYGPRFTTMSTSEFVSTGLVINSNSRETPTGRSALLTRTIKADCDSTEFWAEYDPSQKVTCKIFDIPKTLPVILSSSCPYVSLQDDSTEDVTAFTLTWTSSEVNKTCQTNFIEVSLIAGLPYAKVYTPLTFVYSPWIYSNGTLRQFVTDWKMKNVNSQTAAAIFDNMGKKGNLDLITRRTGEIWYFDLQSLSTSTKSIVEIVSINGVKYVKFDKDQTTAIKRNSDLSIEELYKDGVIFDHDPHLRIRLNHADTTRNVSIQLCTLIQDSLTPTKFVTSCSGFKTNLNTERNYRPAIFDSVPYEHNHKKISLLDCERNWIEGGDWVMNMSCGLAGYKQNTVSVWVNNQEQHEIKTRIIKNQIIFYIINSNDQILKRPLITKDNVWIRIEQHDKKVLRQVGLYVTPSCENMKKKTVLPQPWEKVAELGKGIDKLREDTCIVIRPPKEISAADYYNLYKRRAENRITYINRKSLMEFNWDSHITIVPILMTIGVAQTFLILCGILCFFSY